MAPAAAAADGEGSGDDDVPVCAMSSVVLVSVEWSDLLLSIAVAESSMVMIVM